VDSNRILIGHANVDSGQLLIVDPCYVLGDIDEALRIDYAKVCDATSLSPGYGAVDGAIATWTFFGDGSFPVYALTDGCGRVLEIIIDLDMIGEDDEDDDT